MKNNINLKKSFTRLMSYIYKTYKFSLIIVIISVIISTLSSISISLSLRYIIDDYISPLIGKSNPSFSKLYSALTIIGIIFIIGALLTLLSSLLMLNISQGTMKSLRNSMFEKMQSFPISYFDKNKIGNIMSIYTNDTDTLRQSLEFSFTQTISSVLTILGSLIAMLYLSPLLTLLAIVTLIIVIVVIALFSIKTGMYFGMQQQYIANLTGFIEERMNGQRVVKIFNHEEINKNEFNKHNDLLFEYNYKANRMANVLNPIIGNSGNILFVLTSLLGGFLYINGIGHLTIGSLMAFLQFSRSFTGPLMGLSQQYNSIIMSLAGSERIFNLLDLESEIDNGNVTLVNIHKDNEGNIFECPEKTCYWAWKVPKENGNFDYVELKGDVRFHDMEFSYIEGKTILKNINIYAKPGQKLAFIGATGAGKTTITNLINRFYDIQKGTITYDGIDIKNIKKSDLRRSLGIVLQETTLFTGTIMENIRYGKLDATDEEVYKAAKLAHADKFINMLPHGYNTIISGSSSELSQGQRQLISIARAAISNPPVLILDEATSNIDTRTEKLVQEGMDNLMKNRTVFVIAHRLSTIKNSDAIIVLDNGEIKEKGNHDSLIKEKGIYYQLYTGNLELD